MSHSPRARFIWVAVVLCAVWSTGCSKSSSHPTAPPALRQVGVIVADTTGARVPNATVWAIGIDASTAIHGVTTKQTDAAGVASFSLGDGPWSVVADVTPLAGPTLVAASTGTVGPRPAPDTLLFRLVLRPESVARGKIALVGSSTLDGSLVGVLGLPAFTVTDMDGTYELADLAPGSWPVLVGHANYQGQQFTLVVPAPGDTVDAGTITLSPFPTIARR